MVARWLVAWWLSGRWLGGWGRSAWWLGPRGMLGGLWAVGKGQVAREMLGQVTEI